MNIPSRLGLRVLLGTLTLTSAVGSVGTPSVRERAQTAPEAPSTIDHYNRSDSLDPRSQNPDSVPVTPTQPRTTDRSGVAGGASPTLRGDAAQSHSPSSRQAYAESTTRALDKWDERIRELRRELGAEKGKGQVEDRTRLLSQLAQKSRRDLQELNRTTGAAWLETKARIEARLRRMNREYRRAVAE